VGSIVDGAFQIYKMIVKGQTWSVLWAVLKTSKETMMNGRSEMRMKWASSTRQTLSMQPRR
jgi:hypothetical protein